MKIDTGGKFALGDDPTTGGALSTYSPNQILFSSQSDSLDSPIMTVYTGSTLIVGYNIPAGAVLTLELVSLGGVTPSSVSCARSVHGASTRQSVKPLIVFRTPVTLGGTTWMLTAESPMMVVPVRGTFVLSLNDGTYLGDFHVEAVSQDAQAMPDAYKAGFIPVGVTVNLDGV